MKNPLILVSSGRNTGNLSIQRCQSALYAACLNAAGGAAALYSGGPALPLAQRCDGLLLAGGGDLHPARYGQCPHVDAHLSIDEVRDAEEQTLFEVFCKYRKPVLGVCRGAQLINVFLGGTLHQHIGSHADCCHTVQYTDVLAELLGAQGTVNSYHHQSVNQIAHALTVAARAPDGTVEALIHPSASILSVQWHPERMVPGICEDVTGANHLPLFRWLCERC